jgi:hypothetical protein
MALVTTYRTISTIFRDRGSTMTRCLFITV